MINSIWAGEELPAFPTLAGDLKTDVLIVGGGMAGLLCAWELSQAGVDYALVEADRVFHGVSRNTTAKLTSQHGLIYHKLLKKFGTETAWKYYRANEEALARYRTLAESIDCDFVSRDNYIFSAEQDKLQKEWTALAKLGIPAKYRERIPLPIYASGAIGFGDQAQFDPAKFVRGILPGLKIYEQTPVRKFQKNVAVTDGGNISAGKIIVTTHFPILNKHGSYFLKLYQDRSYVMALENAPDPKAMYLEDAPGGFSFRTQGDLLLLGGGGHRTGKQGGGWEQLILFAKAHYPKAKEVRRWATQDCMSLDGIPYIGPYSARTPYLYVATGFNKWGMTASMLSAMILSDLVQGRENPYAEVFSPSRSVLHPQFLKNAAGAVWNLVTPTVPRCPHMGCALKWNRQERTWDCPCHGSRFAEDGRLLDNPATGDLKK